MHSKLQNRNIQILLLIVTLYDFISLFSSVENNDKSITLYECYCNNCGYQNVCYTDSYCYASFSVHNNNNDIQKLSTIRSCVSLNVEQAVVALFCHYNLTDVYAYTKCCRPDGTTLCNTEGNMPIRNILNNKDYIKYKAILNLYDKHHNWKVIVLTVVAISVVLLVTILSVVVSIFIKHNDTYLKNVVYQFFGYNLRRMVATMFSCKKHNKCSTNNNNYDDEDYPTENSLFYNDNNNNNEMKIEDLSNIINKNIFPIHRSDSLDNLDTVSSLTNSSGAGYPILMESRISNQIKLENLIGAGKFGRVFSGTWKNNPVVVKIVSDTESAKHEAAIYYNYHLRHENILCFISMDNFDEFGPTQYWLIFDYHSKGSMYDYLDSSLNGDTSTDEYLYELKNFLISICAGMSYLHSEIIGHGTLKPRIAHRDIKTKNILIKNDGQCCIADLGMSIVESIDYNQKSNSSPIKSLTPRLMNNMSCSSNNVNDIIVTKYSQLSSGMDASNSYNNNDNVLQISPFISNYRNVGTRRYMAPEIVSSNIISNNTVINDISFNDFLKADIYSLGIVIWEIIRCYTKRSDTGLCYTHEEPFNNYLDHQPSLEQIYPIICENEMRPEVCVEWQNSQLFHGLTELIHNCWHQNPNIRPRIFYIFQKLEYLFGNML